MGSTVHESMRYQAAVMSLRRASPPARDGIFARLYGNKESGRSLHESIGQAYFGYTYRSGLDESVVDRILNERDVFAKAGLPERASIVCWRNMGICGLALPPQGFAHK